MRVSTLRGRSISPVGDLAFVCRFAAFSDSLSTIPENSFTILTCVLASILTQVKQLTFEKLGSLFSSCPNELARSANTIKALCSRNLIKNNIKNRYSGNFVPWHFTIFWQNLQHVGGWTVNSLAEKNGELRDMKSTIEQERRANSQFKIEGSYFPEF